MKKFFKLCLAVAALATMFGFASCSNDSSNDSTTTPAATKTVKTTTVKIGDTEYSYTETDGKVDTSDKVTVADDGSITVTVADGSKVKFSKDGKTITYTDKEGKAYTGQTGGESVTLKSEDGKEITATSKTESKSVPVTPTATVSANVFAGKTFASPEGQVFFIFGSNGKVIFAQGNKTPIYKVVYAATENNFSFTAGSQNVTGSLSGSKLSAGDGNPEHNGTFEQLSGTNAFAGKAFISDDGNKLFVVLSDTEVVMASSGAKKYQKITYTVSGSKITGDGFEATLNGKVLTVKAMTSDGEKTDTVTLIE